mmetsp:Transcript_25331/g.88427  ORF Transcript_25331/g.88427 Transcript_25331/m.88427 type:complete len:221 (-) Transcript_25331:1276-1938(-)
MARVSILAVVGALVAGVALAADPSCSHTFGSTTIDLTAARGKNDYSAPIKGSMTMQANLCGNAVENCLPESWTNPVSMGPAIQTWGPVPSCNPPTCKDASGKAVCCTKNCQVIGQTTSVDWTLLDPSNPASGGVSLTFAGVPSDASDPYWCPFNATSGTQNDRISTFNIKCAPGADPATLDKVSQNGMSGCHWTLDWSSKYACSAEYLASLEKAAHLRGN